MSVERVRKNVDLFFSRWGGCKPLDPYRETLVGFLAKQSIITPLPVYGQIQKDLPTDYLYKSVLDLFERQASAMTAFYASIQPSFDKLKIAKEQPSDLLAPYWNNGYFSGADAKSLYGIMATYRPRHMLEIGSGHSTRFARRAITDFRLTTKITSLDPAPRTEIASIADLHLPGDIHDLDLSLVDRLQQNDILFIDGSHVCLPGTDVPHYALDVLPRVPPGVFVHIHDIALPWEYSEEFRRRGYNEQHIIAAMLLFSSSWEILLPIKFLSRTGRIADGGGSLWLRRSTNVNP